MPTDALPKWEQLLSSAARLQRILPSAVLVGGSAAALHVRHRFSTDADHVLNEYKDLVPKWHDWANVEAVAARVAELLLAGW